MSENEFDVQRDRAEDERDNVVLTGEEIELPGEDSDASAIIGESSEPIHTGEIESVAVGSLTARVPAAAPLKPAIEDRISTGELPIVAAAAGASPAVSSGDEADSAPGSEVPSADADSATPEGDASAEQEAAPEAPADDAPTDEPADTTPEAMPEASSTEPADAAPEAPADDAPTDEPADTTPEAMPEASSTEPADAAPVDDSEHADKAPAAGAVQDEPVTALAHEASEAADAQVSAREAAPADEPEEVASEPEPTRSPIMTPAQAAAALGLNLDSVHERRAEATPAAVQPAEAPAEPAANDAEAPAEPAANDGETPAEQSTEEPESAPSVGGAAAELSEASSPHTLPSRRSMIFGDDEPIAPSIPALRPVGQEALADDAPTETIEGERDADEDAENASPVDGMTKQLPTQATAVSYSFEDQDRVEDERPRRRSLLNADEDDRDAATLAAIASANRDRSAKSSEPASLDDELFGEALQVTEMPSRTGAHLLSFLLFLVLTPLGWYLASDAGARMTLADAAPMLTGVASILALGELLGAVVVTVILCAVARRSSLGAWLMGIVSLLVGLPWVLAPGITASSLLAPLTALSESSSLGSNLSHHLQASGYSGRFLLLGIVLTGVGYLSHSARRTGRAEEALRVSIESVNPAGALYSKRARKRAEKELARK